MEKMRIVVFMSLVGSIVCAGWSYEGSSGPANWASSYPNCAKSKQSPIDLKTSAQLDEKLGKISFSGYGKHDLVASNNGHGAVYALGSSSKPTISAGGLPGTFQLAQFHFHWGTSDATGSEHTVDGKQYPLEIHFVHFNTKYGTISNAVSQSDGLAVLGFFFEVSGANNAYKDVVDALSSVKTTSGTRALAGVDLTSLLGNTDAFYRYSGSLTTPTCDESVTWTVFKKPIAMSADQIAAFRKLSTSDGKAMTFNYRPVQPLNGRVVTTNSGTTVHISTGLVLLCAMLWF